MSAQDKFDLTFTRSDVTLVEIYAATINFSSDTCQNKVIVVQVNTKSAQKLSECPAVISCSAYT